MKILMILEKSFPPDERVENEINILLAYGINITLLCYSSNGKQNNETIGQLNIIRFPVPKIIYKLSALALRVPFYFLFWEKQIRKVLKKESFDALHVHDLPLIKTGYKLSQIYNIPIISDLHENRPEIMKMYKHVNTFPGKYLISIKQWLRYQKKYTPKVDRLILVTEEAKNYYSSNFKIPENKIIVLPNYIVLDRLLNIPDDNSIPDWVKEKFTLVYFGDTGMRRGILTIIEAAKKLKIFPEFHFLILGDSKEQALIEDMVSKEKLTNITLTGWIPLPKAINYIKNAKVGLCPFLRNIHHDTTYANKMFQYMAFGKPVIVSDCTAQANVINTEYCGLVFEAGNSEQLYNKIIKIKNPELYEKLQQNAQKCVLEKYNWELSGKELNKLYETMNNR